MWVYHACRKHIVCSCLQWLTDVYKVKKKIPHEIEEASCLYSTVSSALVELVFAGTLV